MGDKRLGGEAFSPKSSKAELLTGSAFETANGK
jgi:hypothetical protein